MGCGGSKKEVVAGPVQNPSMIGRVKSPPIKVSGRGKAGSKNFVVKDLVQSPPIKENGRSTAGSNAEVITDPLQNPSMKENESTTGSKNEVMTDPLQNPPIKENVRSTTGSKNDVMTDTLQNLSMKENGSTAGSKNDVMTDPLQNPSMKENGSTAGSKNDVLTDTLQNPSMKENGSTAGSKNDVMTDVLQNPSMKENGSTAGSNNEVMTDPLQNPSMKENGRSTTGSNNGVMTDPLQNPSMKENKSTAGSNNEIMSDSLQNPSMKENGSTTGSKNDVMTDSLQNSSMKENESTAGSNNEVMTDPLQNPSIKANGSTAGSNNEVMTKPLQNPLMKVNWRSTAKAAENQKSKESKHHEIVAGDEQSNKHQYKKIDAHARKAPQSLKNSVEDLVNYMSSFSKEPRILARGFFVWISENIRYDVDGYFGRTSKASCDALSVMQGGTSVCAGYANVMETLCRQANIPVKNISGFAKGASYSATRPFSLDHRTNHAWNAIQLDGKWYLLDCTWGTGHLDSSNTFRKEFNEFFFLSVPAHFVHSHFPYMDHNLTESMKWQLLANPISLEEFNNNVEYQPAAFKLGLEAFSHPHGLIHMKDEIEIIFTSTKVEDVVVSARLMLKEDNWLKEQPNATFGVPGHNNGTYKLLVHPPKVGMYIMHVFCEKVTEEKHEGSTSAMNYVINCTAVKEHGFEYPMFYSTTRTEKAILHEPLRGKLQQNTLICFKIMAPYLQHMKVGKTFLQKTGNTFTGEVKTGSAGEDLKVSGTREEKYSTYWGLFKFKII